jgi:hypothetical protein
MTARAYRTDREHALITHPSPRGRRRDASNVEIGGSIPSGCSRTRSRSSTGSEHRASTSTRAGSNPAGSFINRDLEAQLDGRDRAKVEDAGSSPAGITNSTARATLEHMRKSFSSKDTGVPSSRSGCDSQLPLQSQHRASRMNDAHPTVDDRSGCSGSRFQSAQEIGLKGSLRFWKPDNGQVRFLHLLPTRSVAPVQTWMIRPGSRSIKPCQTKLQKSKI